MNRRFSKSIFTAIGLSLCSSVSITNAAESVAAKMQQQATPDKSAMVRTAVNKQKTNVYIVELKDDPLMGFEGNAAMRATKPVNEAKLATSSKAVQQYKSLIVGKQDQALANCGVARHNKIYEYTTVFNGMAAIMTPEQAALMRTDPNVKTVFKDEILKPHTDSTPAFLGLNKRRVGAWRQRYTGEDIIVGVLDSGIDPENPSFADVPTRARGDRGRKIPYGPPPASWSGDECDFGNTAYYEADVPFECNNKVLGARSYSAGFLRGEDPTVGLSPRSSLSARDDDGHGSAAASNAAGNYGVQAIINGEEVGEGVMSGVAPRARIAVYKVCWNGPILDDPTTPVNEDDDDGCATSDSMAAIDQAVADGVDVINFSIGGSSTVFNGADDRAFLFAAAAGVHVATSAGNAGSDRGTIGTPAGVPWITAVGAINDNQNFAQGLNVDSPVSVAGLKIAIEGSGSVRLADIAAVSGELAIAEPADACAPLTNPDTIDGNIALVIRGGCSFDMKYAEAEAAGAVAIVVYNDGTAPDRQNPIPMGAVDASRGIPGVMISFSDGDALANESDVTVTLDAANQVSMANTVAGFSSRGANLGAPDIIKPDVVAPGVNILSAETPTENEDAGPGGESFQFIGGTSFSSPHVAGVMALLKQAHPDWTPAQVRSAIMTTARQNLTNEFSTEPATPFDIGAGHVVPNDSFNPGLTYDAGLSDYAAFSCGNNVSQFSDDVCDFLAADGYSFEGSALNLPSIGVSQLVGTESISRTVTNVDQPNENRRRQKATKYRAEVDAPDGVRVRVSPRTLKLRPGESASYDVSFETKEGAVVDEFAFGSITWVEKGKRRGRYSRYDDFFREYFPGYRKHYYHNRSAAREVYSPVAVRPVAIATAPQASGAGTDGQIDVPVKFGYSGDYSAGLSGLVGPAISIPDSVFEADDFNLYCFDLPALDHLRITTFDEDTTTPGQDDLDLEIYTVDACGAFDGLTQVGTSLGATSNEVVDLSNSPAGSYLVLVDHFAAAPGGDEITYVLDITAVAGDEGNAVVSAPTSVSLGAEDSVTVEWADLDVDTRYLGVLRHEDANGEIARTLLDVSTK